MKGAADIEALRSKLQESESALKAQQGTMQAVQQVRLWWKPQKRSLKCASATVDIMHADCMVKMYSILSMLIGSNQALTGDGTSAKATQGACKALHCNTC